MSKNIMLYDSTQKTIDTDLLQIYRTVNEYSNKPFVDKTQPCRDAYDKAVKHREERLSAFENKDKEYKAIKRYGYVLDKVLKLLNIIPKSNENFTLTELAEKIQELMNSRKEVAKHTSFTYFQNVLTNSITNILNIEQDFRSGAINERTASARVDLVIEELNRNSNQIPNEMFNIIGSSFDQAISMAIKYEKMFSTVGQKLQRTGFNFLDTDLTEEQKTMTEELNIKTLGLMEKIKNLNGDMNSFEPQVDLKDVTELLEKTDSFMTDSIFDADNLDASVTNLENVTDRLITEQNEKNQTAENIQFTIQSLTDETERTSKKGIRDSVIAASLSISGRFNATSENILNIQNAVRAGTFPESVAAEILKVIDEQAKDDKHMISAMNKSSIKAGVSADAELYKASYNVGKMRDKAQDALEEVKERDPFSYRYDDDEDYA